MEVASHGEETMRHRPALLSLILTLLLGGCTPTIRPVTGLGQEDTGRVVLGEPLPLVGSWWAMCTTGHLDKNGPHEEVCHRQRVRLEAWCEGPCRVEGPRVREGETGTSATVVALGLGRIQVHAKNTRLSTGEVNARTFAVEVLPPERLALGCREDAMPQSFGRCGPRGVPAAAPMIRPEIYLDGEKRSSRLLRVNSVVTPISHVTVGLSLARLFPEARQGGGVKPGTYPIELSLAGITERFQVLAQ
jgi:hypothetical protein